jgi:hypothetical protein
MGNQSSLYSLIIYSELIVFIETKHDGTKETVFALFGRWLPMSALVYGCTLSGTLFTALFLRSLLQNQHSLWMVKAGIKLQSMVTTALFAKVIFAIL